MAIKPDVANFHTLIPLPGTKIYNELNDKNLILENNWSKYTFHDIPVFRSEHLSQVEIQNQYKNAYKRYHLRLFFIFSRIFRMKSFADLKNNVNGLATLLKFLK